MKSRACQLAAMVLSVVAISAAAAKDAGVDFITEHIRFKSGTRHFSQVYPVTENLNNIMAELSKAEVEQGRPIPNFLIYPFSPEEGNADPFALIWTEGRYLQSDHLPADGSAFLVYDPRRMSAGDLEVEEGQRVEYRHFIVRFGFNNAPEERPADLSPAARLEPTEASVYISRRILRQDSGAAKADPAHQVICFPLISIPKKYQGQDVQVVSLRVESALRPSPDSGSEGAAPAQERSIFRVN